MSSSEKPRISHDDGSLYTDIKVVLLDIEGTTTPLDFVQKTLFPYIKDNVREYLKTHWEEKELQADVEALRKQAVLDQAEDGSEDVPGIPQEEEESEQHTLREQVEKNVVWQMASDRKTTALKQLQGHMWRQAFQSASIVGVVYQDVVPAIEQWVAEGKKVYIYSSGSIEAQKLLFGHTQQGNLLEFISGHFDTKIGAKVEKESYAKIAQEIACQPSDILFLTDVTKEARAAREAGCRVGMVVRPGNTPLSATEQEDYRQVHSFSEIVHSK